MKDNQKGFTLVELMVTVLIASILIGVGVPSFMNMLRSNRTATIANELLAALYLTRSEALKRSVQVTMIKSGVEWEDGWQLISDIDGDGVLDLGDGDEVIKIIPVIHAGYTLRTGGHFNNWVAYRPDGRSRGNGGSNDTFRLCADDQEATTGRSVVVNLVGRIRMEEGTSACP